MLCTMIRQNMYIYLVLVIYLINISNTVCESDFNLIINANGSLNSFKQFWKSTGFCPPAPRGRVSEFLLSKDVKTNLVLIGALPNRGIKYVRIHWLLDMITISSFAENQTPIYNFTNLDQIVNVLHLNNLYPGFEIMGNPSDYFNNFMDPLQKQYWTYLVRNIVLRYLEIYGNSYLSKWRFETWNEPDLKGYNILNFTFAGYMQYVTACADGLQLAGRHGHGKENIFRLGGPAGLFKSPGKHPLCWGMMTECNNSPDTCPLHFISYHKKGDATAEGVVQKGLAFLDEIRRKYPNLQEIPVANDEADILTGWSKSKQWRADTRYAAMMVKVIIDHYYKFIEEMGMEIEVLSNDNAFLNYHPYYFTQRTLFSRFQMNNTNPPHSQFIKKPVYVTMALLSYLGNKVLNLKFDGTNSYVSTLATTTHKNNRFEYSVILAYVNDTIENEKRTKTFDISMQNLPNLTYKYVVYLLDNTYTNPYNIWRKNGAPVFPNLSLRTKMRDSEGPYRLIGPANLLLDANVRIRFTCQLPSVALIHICSNGGHSPGQVTKVQVMHVTTNEILITWKDQHIETKCIRSYEVEFLSDVIGNGIDDQLFTKVNLNDVIFLWFHYVATGVPEATAGLYRVRALDYWDRAGPYSTPVRLPQ